jgi:hypothetical protein
MVLEAGRTLLGVDYSGGHLTRAREKFPSVPTEKHDLQELPDRRTARHDVERGQARDDSRMIQRHPIRAARSAIVPTTPNRSWPSAAITSTCSPAIARMLENRRQGGSRPHDASTLRTDSVGYSARPMIFTLGTLPDRGLDVPMPCHRRAVMILVDDGRAASGEATRRDRGAGSDSTISPQCPRQESNLRPAV